MNYDNDYCDEDFDAVEMRRQAMFEKYKEARLARNPDCRDPDHPGCQDCMGDDDGQDAD